MNGKNPQPGNLELPLMEMITDAFRYVYDERKDFIALASLPVIALALIASGLNFLMPDGGVQVDESGMPVSIGPLVFVNIFVSIVFFAIFAVAWYRKFLVGEEDVTVGAALKLDGRKIRFVIRLGGLLLLCALLMMPVVIGFQLISAAGLAFGPIAIFVMLVVGLLVYARGSLWLIAAAVDDPTSLRAIWRGTNGFSWRLVVLVVAPPMLLLIIQMLVLNIAALILGALGLMDSMTGGLILLIIQESLSYLGIAVVASALSMAYLRFKASWV